MSELDRVEAASSALAAWAEAPELALVLGSGLASALDVPIERSLSFQEIPGFLPPTVPGHDGRLTLRSIEGTHVACLEGRVHMYEGHTPADVVRPVRAVGAWGCRTLILTNSAGSLGAELGQERLMLIADHLNFTGRSPLEGPNEAQWGPRFPDMSEVYDGELRRRLVHRLACPEGVYAGVLGPEYETPAMVRFLRAAGADAVGMSTVLEATAARHLGLRVLGVSCLTNLAAGIGEGPLSHAEVTEGAHKTRESLMQLLRVVVGELGHSDIAQPGQNG
ncbi:MAG: purine-nucleoside phosphorylase [Myxococcota bacterium]